MATKKEEENSPTETTDEEFFKKHGVTEDEDKNQFRRRYLYDLYKEDRDANRKPANKPTKKGFFE